MQMLRYDVGGGRETNTLSWSGLIIIQRRYGCSNFTRVDFRFSLAIIFAIDPLSVYKLIEVLHRLIQCTEIYISTELSEIAHG